MAIEWVSIVEGDGEVQALPVLLRRFLGEFQPKQWPNVRQPLLMKRDRFLKFGNEERGFIKTMNTAADMAGDGYLLVLLDADDDCPVEIARAVRAKAEPIIRDRLAGFVCVVASREYESWFLAAAESLRGRCGINDDFCAPINHAEKRDAKAPIAVAMGGRYREVVDQAKLSACFDLGLARDNNRSFRKLYESIVAFMAHADQNARDS